MQAVILCGGENSRFEPFNTTRPKCLIPLAGTSLLGHQIAHLMQGGVKKIIIVTTHFTELIQHEIMLLKTGVDISVIKQKGSGTAAAVLSASEYLSGDFFVLYGDIATSKENIKSVIDAGPNSIATVPFDNRLKDIGCYVENDANITVFSYRGRDGHYEKSNHKVAGIFYLKREIIELLKSTPARFLSVPSGIATINEACLEQTLQDYLDLGNTLKAVMLKDWYHDIDYCYDILHANHKALASLASSSKKSIHKGATALSRSDHGLIIGEGSIIEENVQINGFLQVGKNSVIHKGCIINGPTVIGDECEFGNYAQFSGSFSNRVHIGFSSEVSGVWMEGAWCVHHGFMAGVFGERVNIGAGTVTGTLRHDDKNIEVLIKSEKNDSGFGGLGVFMGDYSRTGVGALLMPGRIVGTGALIGPGVILYKNVKPNQMVLVKQDLVFKNV